MLRNLPAIVPLAVLALNLAPASPVAAQANVAFGSTRVVTNDIIGGAPGTPRNVTITNNGNAALNLSGLTLTGVSGGEETQFQLTPAQPLPLVLTPGASTTVGVVFNPTVAGPVIARLGLTSDAANNASVSVSLQGLGTLGIGTGKEPSLQWVLDTYLIPVNVGDTNPATDALPATVPLGEEISPPQFRKASSSPVTVEALAVFSGQGAPGYVVSLGYYTAGNPNAKTQLFTVPNANYQSLAPATTGTLSFDPGNNSFGLYSVWPFLSNRTVYSEERLNTFSGAIPHQTRIYPLKKSDGTREPNAYVVSIEETTINFDFQDLVLIVRNVKPVPPGDFYGNVGKSDILLRNPVTGENTVWQMNDAAFLEAFPVAPVGDANWEIVGTPDLNFDGKVDILWRNKATGANSVWLMNGTAFVSSVVLASVGDLNWQIAGTGDLNFDGKVDILWRNKVTGANSVWLMNGSAFVSSVALPAVADLGWQIVGAGDFTGDSRPDILWRNQTTGANTVWRMSGTTFGAAVAIASVSDPGWLIGGVGDYNSDNKPDILWHNQTTGVNSIWRMNGTTLSSSVAIPALEDLNWQIRGPR
ncbi:FG-GAP-like repeat-containing protein [Gloeobacter violaceus]|uniref:Gll0047 protein n=1 Tax=Gloeobacter violaceus (strain ATCC 29082 / PCC 7421) TaxID=251221 RepID=Q7NPK8_GLOVI|nr:FG-GAP-like repeat-containing protein [Gloeobacter violaceus]BAC87988.1 gll0047 [Gloeobacter violaceus PCC 7421]